MERFFSDLVIDPLLIRKYGVGGPDYGHYPTVERFVEAFDEAQLAQWLAKRGLGGRRPLSLSVRLPPGRSPRQLACLQAELTLVARLAGDERRIRRLHCAGGTAAFLLRGEIAGLVAAIDRHFERDAGAECSIEVDARRLEVGDARAAVAEARASGFRSVTLELACGLPRTTLDGFNRALERSLALDPDRVVLDGQPPSPASAEDWLQILTLAIGRLTRGGYLYLGMDQFARPGGVLAQSEGDTLALGPAAVGCVGPTCYQNLKQFDGYRTALGAGRLPLARGIELTPDDLVRRAVIQGLIGQFRVSIESIELAHLIDFRRYFAAEIADLRRLADDGLVELAVDWIVVSPKGRLLVRAIAMVFDRYLRERTARASYARLI